MQVAVACLAVLSASCTGVDDAGLASTGSEGIVLFERMVDVGTHRLRAFVAGEGVPVVVIDGGLGVRSEEYGALQVRVAANTTVIRYDRAGYGGSEAGPVPRDSGTEADELRALLEGLGVPGPYVMVGHSLGGLNLEVFADRYPNQVAGLVLLDPPPLAWLLGEGFPDLLDVAQRTTDEWQDAADRGLNSSDSDERSEALFLHMLASEHREMVGSSARLADEIETFAEIPLFVIASGVPNPQFGARAADYQRYWIEQSRDLASKSNQGNLILAKDSTHQLHDDATDLVVESIVSLVEGLRGHQ